MKKISRLISAGIIIATVSGLLAFKAFGLGTIYCIPDAQVSAVDPNKSCTNQPAGINAYRVDYGVSFNPADPTANPCPAGFTPFDNSQLNKCIQKVPGTDHFVATLP